MERAFAHSGDSDTGERGVFSATFFTVPRRRERPAATEQGGEYHSAFTGKGIVTPAAAATDLGDVTLSERRQAQRDEHRVRPLL